MVLLSVLAVGALFVGGATSLDVTGTTTLTDPVASGDSITVESGGLVTINDQSLIINLLTVDAGGQFYYSTTSATSTVQFSSIINNDLVYFASPSTNDIHFNLGTNIQNNGVMVINGLFDSVTIQSGSNTGQLTFWQEDGLFELINVINTGNICFYDSMVDATNPSGNGCMALYDSTFSLYSPQDNFNPSIVFEGGASQFYIETGGQNALYTLIQFGGGHTITAPNDGFSALSYSPDTGIAVVQQNGYQLSFDVGPGYDSSLFTYTNRVTYIIVSYGAAVPPGANSGGCSCVSIPPPTATTASSTSINF
ncbi:hypothetical protein JA1_001434 [Spathaspora sp. JA1]|nr:hypothetical protein JA1_001434 [Spathaspora sp. JA1]